MNANSPSVRARFSNKTNAVRKIILGLIFVVGAGTSTYGQGDIPSGTVSGSGSGPYSYSLTFADAAGSTSPIGSIWYAWTPGNFYLPGTPTSASTPSGWTANIFANSIQFSANSPANDITAGSSLSGFGYVATFTPAQLAAAANSGKSVAYTGGIESDAGVTFFVTPVPEPSTLALLALGTTALLVATRRCKFRAG